MNAIRSLLAAIRSALPQEGDWFMSRYAPSPPRKR